MLDEGLEEFDLPRSEGFVEDRTKRSMIGVVALGVYSLVGDGGLANSAVESLLGLPGETLETAFALGSV